MPRTVPLVKWCQFDSQWHSFKPRTSLPIERCFGISGENFLPHTKFRGFSLSFLHSSVNIFRKIFCIFILTYTVASDDCMWQTSRMRSVYLISIVRACDSWVVYSTLEKICCFMVVTWLIPTFFNNDLPLCSVTLQTEVNFMYGLFICN